MNEILSIPIMDVVTLFSLFFFPHQCLGSFLSSRMQQSIVPKSFEWLLSRCGKENSSVLCHCPWAWRAPHTIDGGSFPRWLGAPRAPTVLHSIGWHRINSTIIAISLLPWRSIFFPSSTLNGWEGESLERSAFSPFVCRKLQNWPSAIISRRSHVSVGYEVRSLEKPQT